MDAALYTGGFISDSEKSKCHLFHKAEHHEKAGMIEQFKDPRLKDIALRIMGRHFEEHLTDYYKNQFTEYLASIFSEEKVAMTQGYKKDEFRPTRLQIQLETEFIISAGKLYPVCTLSFSYFGT